MSRTANLLRGRALALALALVVTVVLGELALRVVSSVTLVQSLEMVRYAKELKMPDPRGEVSHVHRANASAHLMGVDVKLNALGNRGPDLPPKSKDKKRVLVLGSSVTMGWGVPYDELFTTLVERRFDAEHPLGPDVGLEIANAGIGNYDTKAQAALFAREFPELKPDLVVVHYFISDAEPRTMGRDGFLLRHSELAAYLFDRVRTVQQMAEGKTDLSAYYADVYSAAHAYWSAALELLAHMRDVAAADRAPFVVMVVPDFHDLGASSRYAAIYRTIDAGLAARGIAHVDTFPTFRDRYGGKESQLWIQRGDPHPNALGHAVMADLLYAYLIRPGAFDLRPAETPY